MKVQAETCLTGEPSSDPLEIYPVNTVTTHYLAGA